jgi:hypothetical protein
LLVRWSVAIPESFEILLHPLLHQVIEQDYTKNILVTPISAIVNVLSLSSWPTTFQLLEQLNDFEMALRTHIVLSHVMLIEHGSGNWTWFMRRIFLSKYIS